MYRPDDVIRASYTIEKTQSQRGPIITYTAKTREGERVILRCLHMHDVTDWSSVGRFEKTVQTLKRMQYQTLPRILDFFEDENGPEPSYCMVRKYAEGTVLSDTINANQPGPRETAQSVLEQGLDTLSWFHSFSAPVVHGSIRPEHLIVSPEGKLSLLWNGEQPETELYSSERRREGQKQDIRDLGLSVLSYLYGLRYEDLSYGDPYTSGLVPQPAGLLERVVFLMLHQSENSAPLNPKELRRLLSGGRIPERNREKAPDAAETDDGSSYENHGNHSTGNPMELDETGALIRRMGTLSIRASDRKDIVSVDFPAEDRAENQIARFVLETWLRWPWAVIIVLSMLSGGSFFVPLVIFSFIPASRRLIRKLYARFRDSRVTIGNDGITSIDQPDPIPLKDIDDIRLKRKIDERGKISLQITLVYGKDTEKSFTIHHLNDEQADAVSEFLLERIAERRHARYS